MAISKKMRRNRSWIAVGVLVAVAGAAYYFYRQSQPAQPSVSYTTEQVSAGTLSVTVAGTGNVEVDGTTDVYPRVSGEVASVKVAEGDHVTTGTVLFTLDPASAEAATARAYATYQQTQQQVAQAQANVTRAQNTLARLKEQAAEPSSTVTADDITAAAADLDSAKAGLASAKASRTTAGLDYEDAAASESDLVVKSPCSGQVYSLAIEAGDTVSSGSGATSTSSANAANVQGGSVTASTSSAVSSGAPVVIAPTQPLAVHLTINEVDLPSLKAGQRADIEFDALPGLTATGKVYDIADEGTSSSGVVTFDVWLSVDDADARLRPGMSAAATIVTNVVRDTLLVPNSAVKSASDGSYYVQVMRAGATAPTQVTVETGLASATQTQVLSGLSEGDTVVVSTVDNTDSSSSGNSGPGAGMMAPGMGGGFRD
ncbi:MAG: efflux RND transporter periplasmic adaptor subunit [Coriobacteriales bacterium]|nr:efflux RND transporter periplasmic adaptor subunit [Actinomycetes bacterium]